MPTPAKASTFLCHASGTFMELCTSGNDSWWRGFRQPFKSTTGSGSPGSTAAPHDAAGSGSFASTGSRGYRSCSDRFVCSLCGPWPDGNAGSCRLSADHVRSLGSHAELLRGPESESGKSGPAEGLAPPLSIGWPVMAQVPHSSGLARASRFDTCHHAKVERLHESEAGLQLRTRLSSPTAVEVATSPGPTCQ